VVRVVLEIQDVPQHKRRGFLGLCGQQFLAIAEPPPVGDALDRIVARAIGIDWPCAWRSMKPGATTSPVASIIDYKRQSRNT
jgi:hypothetical protein